MPPTRRRWLALAFVLLAAACGGGTAERLTIAVVPKGTAHEFWKAVHLGAQQAAAALDVDIRWQGPQPEGDRQAQIHLLQNLVSARVHGIVLAPVDDQALAAPVAEAKAAGVPTVVIDSGLGGNAHVAFIATDNHAGGVLGGERLASLLGGKGRVIMLRFQQGSASTMAREAGCLEALGRFTGIEILSSDQYAGDTEKARTAGESLLVAHPDVDGVFCPNESTTHGFLRALEGLGRAGKVKFVGFDGSAPLVRGLEQGHIDALVLQDPVAMGRRGVEVMVAHLRGRSVTPRETTDLVLASRDNRDDPRVASLLEPERAR
jgi:ribose transport system substrate-binding protein